MQTFTKIATSVVNKGALSMLQIKNIAELINQVYLRTESDFWPNNGLYERTNPIKLTQYIKNNELIIATIADEIVGAVHVYPLENDHCGFGMFVASRKKRGLGVGTSLMKRVENWALANNYKTIQLELLKPKAYIHPEKEFLNKWYTKLGYTLINKIPYGDLYPEQAHLLKIPCDFEIYQKKLKI